MRTHVWATAIVLSVLSACGGTTTGGNPLPPDEMMPMETPMTYPVLADSLALDTIAIFQGVKVTLASGGAKPDKMNAPVIAGRPGVVRVYVTPKDGWKAKTIDAELHLAVGTDTTVLTASKMISTASTDKDTTSTFNFELTAEQIVADLNFSVVLRDHAVPADRPEGGVSYPTDGTMDNMDPDPAAKFVRVKIVPVKYDADGSGRLPDISMTQLALFHDTIYKMYPTANVDLTVRDPWSWNQPIEANGTGWDDLLNGLVDLRASDNPKTDVYYVAAFAPAPSIQDFCSGGGCILGIAPLTGANDVSERVAMVLGYTGQTGPNTLNQELGHAMGRDHAPCGGAGGPDPKYPYAGGKIGVWGYDLLTKQYVDPASKSRDFMGYCHPLWVSDYTYNGLYARVRYVNKTAMSVLGSQTRVQSLLVDGTGHVRTGRSYFVPANDTTISGENDVQLSFLGADGSSLASSVRGRWLPYDNIPGGMLVLPASETPARFARVHVARANETVSVLSRR